MATDSADLARQAALERVDDRQRAGTLTESEAETVRKAVHEAVTADEIREVCEDHLAEDADAPDWNDPGRPEAPLQADVLPALEAIDGPATASEVADELDETYWRIKRRLERLHEDGRVEQKQIAGRITVWWPADGIDS